MYNPSIRELKANVHLSIVDYRNGAISAPVFASQVYASEQVLGRNATTRLFDAHSKFYFDVYEVNAAPWRDRDRTYRV